MSTGTSAAVHIADVEEDREVVVIRRNAWLSGVVGGLSALLGLAYLVRGSGPVDGVVGVVLLLLAVVHGSALGTAHTPVLVADEHGIRLRVGLTWRGLPWSAVRQVVVEHADSPLREGRLVAVPRDPVAALDHVGRLGRLHLRWNHLWYGAALSVPLGMTTLTDTHDLGGDLTDLAAGRADVVYLRGRQLAQLDEVVSPPRESPDDEPPADAHSHAHAHAFDEVEAAPTVEPDPAALLLPEPVAPLRALNLPIRAEVRLDAPAMRPSEDEPAPDHAARDHAAHDHAAHDDPTGFVPAQRRPDEAGIVADLVHAEAWEEVPVEVEADDLAIHEPDDGAPRDPVIGPRIAHARTMLGLGVDELSQRTRIRPHVIEAIEADDFGPCGGDFYARGHLTAIARVLGLDLEPLMKEYDDRYAGGPINARRVFEAELATGLSSGMRATRGGPRWTLLIGAVLCLTMVWGVARLLTGAPEQIAAAPAATSDSAGLAAKRQPITSPLMKTTPMTVTAAHAGAHVVVKDRTGRVLWSGDLRMTHHRKVVGLAPFTVQSDNAGAIEVTIAGTPMGTLGVAGKSGSKRYQ